MRFGPIPLAEAEGAIAAHSVRLNGAVIRKGTRLGAPEIAALKAAGLSTIVAARIEAGDVAEDAAAGRLAAAVAGEGVAAEAPFTGRANLHALEAGVLVFDAAGIDAFNAVDEAVTLATLPALQTVAQGEMVATVKIIPFAVPEAQVAAAAAAGARIRVAPFARRRVALISTRLPGLHEKVIDKTLAITRARLAPAGAGVVADLRIPHETAALAQAIGAVAADGAEMIVVFGASAIADRRDVIPAALAAAGGEVLRLGMPVDPGNLLLLGRLGDIPVLGAPGCARSPKENGFDFVLMRLLADLPVEGADIARMGAGGLLKEIVSRPQPRAEPAEMGEGFAAVVLAAGRSTRMGGANKLLEAVDGAPVIRRVAAAALASRARPVIVVTGHEREKVEQALAGLDVAFVHNADFASGMASSLRAGIGAVPEEAAGALVVLGDMPLVAPRLMDRLMAAFSGDAGRLIAVPVADGARGHPVLWSRRYFPELAALEGDTGARQVLAANAAAVVEVEAEGPGAFLDVDTPELLAAARKAAQPKATEPAR
ncbi:NTP transferase domain-containing protein [Xanthobacter tagetidis]|uniref:4-diphosphocytidyl-2C-methyl-D-erythritol kinase n=1 Tax=Xanthobacter tagetidis TaxID=60216 RepID=A0A3L7ANP5_9HYPH|nr:NTP transferase domain-containing protein [Xanthobacter tagetidis]MBB6307514.1 molybdenum cofactor cytidylyltransferase [Xanthobacter tagetidis]RLP81251.1 4-diphosphocytidyl-2C-methyl-D-erythritol kinase [Xanthobacter tagetidis]